MKTVPVQSAKLTVVFRAGDLPSIDPSSPMFDLAIGDPPTKVAVRINAKAARKLAIWAGGAMLQGNLRVENGRLVLGEAGFSFLDPKPATTPSPDASVAAPTRDQPTNGQNAPQSHTDGLAAKGHAPGPLAAVLRRSVAPTVPVH